MKDNLIRIAVITALNSGPYISFAHAETTDIINPTFTSKKIKIKEKIKKTFTKEYNYNYLLNILADIETNLESNNIEALKGKSEEIANYLNYHKNKNQESDINYKGDKLLELQYGSWLEPKELLLPLELDNNSLTTNFLQNRIFLSNFQENEIDDAKIRYVSYNVKNENFTQDLYNLISSINNVNIKNIRKDVKRVQKDILIDNDDKISLVSKIKDNLILAKYLAENNQFKAAQNSIDVTDKLALKLIEATSNSPEQQAKIKKLRKELNNISKLSDENYISQWEKIPEEVGNWWHSKAEK